MANVFKWCWDLIRGKSENGVVPAVEEPVPLRLKRRIDDNEVTSPKRMRYSESNITMAKPVFRIEESKLADRSRAEWTSAERSRLLNPLMESADFINNKENVLAMNGYRENHERTTSSISKSEQSVLEESDDDDPAVVCVLPPGTSSPVPRRNVNRSRLSSQTFSSSVARKTLLQNVPSSPIYSAEMPTIVLSDEDEVQVLENTSQRKGKHFFSTPHGLSMQYSTASVRRPSDILKGIKKKPVKSKGLIFNDFKHNSTISTVNNFKEKKQFHDLILQYAIRNKNQAITPRRGYLDSPATLLKSHPVITIDHTGDDEIEVVDVVQSRESNPITSATMTGEGGAKPKQPSTHKFLSSSIFSDSQFIKRTKEKYKQKDEETKRNMKKPQAVAEFLEAQNSRSITACEEGLLAHFSRMEIVLPDVIEVPKLPELTEKMQEEISSAMRPTPRQELLIEAFSVRITRHDMQTLCGSNWLNDEVINYYMNLLIERGKRDGFLNVYAFNTFFYPKLLSGGHASLKRWTKKVDIFAQDLVIVPVHLGVHWCLASVDFRDRTIRYYDSMGSPNNRCLTALLQYLRDESQDKKKCPYDTSDWKAVNLKEIPQQMNGSDCGMFACMFAEYICRNVPITFTQKDMPYFRRKMAYEILTKRLMDFK